MKLSDHLSEKDKKKLKKIKKERINWHDIMGVNRQIYKRVRGAIRRK